MIDFGQLGWRVIEARFDGGSMSGDGGVMLLAQVDRKLGFMDAAARCIANPRFIVTNLQDQAQALYDKVYCQRGEAENRIKEVQIGLFATRTSCHTQHSNQVAQHAAHPPVPGLVLAQRADL